MPCASCHPYFLFSLLAVLCGQTPVGHAASIPKLFNTGVDDTGKCSRQTSSGYRHSYTIR